jgi:hypothetical protein
MVYASTINQMEKMNVTVPTLRLVEGNQFKIWISGCELSQFFEKKWLTTNILIKIWASL